MYAQIRDCESGESLRIKPEGTSLGRVGGGADIEVAGPSISAMHARVFRRGSQWFLEDLGSSNGTFVLGKKIAQPVPLSVGMEFSLSRHGFEVKALPLGQAGESEPTAMFEVSTSKTIREDSPAGLRAMNPDPTDSVGTAPKSQPVPEAQAPMGTAPRMPMGGAGFQTNAGDALPDIGADDHSFATEQVIRPKRSASGGKGKVAQSPSRELRSLPELLRFVWVHLKVLARLVMALPERLIAAMKRSVLVLFVATGSASLGVWGIIHWSLRDTPPSQNTAAIDDAAMRAELLALQAAEAEVLGEKGAPKSKSLTLPGSVSTKTPGLTGEPAPGYPRFKYRFDAIEKALGQDPTLLQKKSVEKLYRNILTALEKAKAARKEPPKDDTVGMKIYTMQLQADSFRFAHEDVDKLYDTLALGEGP